MTMLDVSLSRWLGDNWPADEFLWSGAARRQALFFRDTLPQLLFDTYEKAEQGSRVVSTHRSKSVLLPVVEYRVAGLRYVMRDNFYDVKVSVWSPRPLVLAPGHLFTVGERHDACYCEGFRAEDVLGPYMPDSSRFTVSVAHDHAVWALCLMIRQALEVSG